MTSRGGDMAANTEAVATMGSAAGDEVTAAEHQSLSIRSRLVRFAAEIAKLDDENAAAVADELKKCRLKMARMDKEAARMRQVARKKYEDAVKALQKEHEEAMKAQEEQKALLCQEHEREMDELKRAAAQQEAEEPDYKALLTELREKKAKKLEDYQAELDAKLEEEKKKIRQAEAAAEDDFQAERSAIIKSTEEELKAMSSTMESTQARFDELEILWQEKYDREYEDAKARNEAELAQLRTAGDLELQALKTALEDEISADQVDAEAEEERYDRGQEPWCEFILAEARLRGVDRAKFTRSLRTYDSFLRAAGPNNLSAIQLSLLQRALEFADLQDEDVTDNNSAVAADEREV